MCEGSSTRPTLFHPHTLLPPLRTLRPQKKKIAQNQFATWINNEGAVAQKSPDCNNNTINHITVHGKKKKTIYAGGLPASGPTFLPQIRC